MGLGRIVQMLKTSKEFDFVYKNSYKFRTEMLDICILRANLASEFFAKFRRLPCNLVGFSVSKKVGNAVERNLIKRRLRAICREFFNSINSSLGASCVDLANFECSQTISLVSHSKFATQRVAKQKRSTTSTANTRICLDSNQGDSSDSNESKDSPSLAEGARWWVKSTSSSRGDSIESPKQSTNHTNQSMDCHDFATQNLAMTSGGISSDSIESTSDLRGSIFRRFCGFSSARQGNRTDSSIDEAEREESRKSVKNTNAQNLICIFIAKSQILQTPFATLKSIIFDALKKQVDFRQDLHKKSRMSRHNAKNRTFQNPNYIPNKGAL